MSRIEELKSLYRQHVEASTCSADEYEIDRDDQLTLLVESEARVMLPDLLDCVDHSVELLTMVKVLMNYTFADVSMIDPSVLRKIQAVETTLTNIGAIKHA